MGKYAEYVSQFEEDYEQPVVEEYIVGFSGIDPDKKVKPETISHEKLDGLLGGDFAGRYHVTHDELALFRDYQGQITKLSGDTANEFAKVRKETSDGLKEVREEASEKIASLRESAYGKIEELSRHSELEISRVEREASEALSHAAGELASGISRVEREAAQALGEAAEALSAEISRVDDKTVSAISTYKAETTRAVSEISGDVRTFTAQAGNRLSAVETANAEIAREQAMMTERYESAMTALTEDSEVIDARVSEDGTRYGTLGGRLRAMDAVSSRGLGTLHETDAGLWDALQEVSGDASSTLLTVMDDLLHEGMTRKAADAEIREELSASREKAAASHDHLQEQASELAGMTLTQEIAIHELGDDLKAEADSRYEHDRDLQDRLSAEEETRQRVDDEIRQEISQTRTGTTARRECLQEQASEIAGEILRLTYEREVDTATTAKGLAREETHRVTLAEHMQEQADTLSCGLLTEMLSRKADEERICDEIRREERKRTDESERRREDSENLAYGIITNVRNLAHERSQREKTAWDLEQHIWEWRVKSEAAETRMRAGLCEVSAHAREMSQDNAAGLLILAGEMLKSDEQQKLIRAEMQSSAIGQRKILNDTRSWLQEQINELAYMKLCDLQTERENNDRIAIIERDMDAILSELDPEYEPAEDDEIDDMIDRVLAGETVSGDGEYDDPEFDEMIDEIYGVNP